jgi:hypothetical protein
LIRGPRARNPVRRCTVSRVANIHPE